MGKEDNISAFRLSSIVVIGAMMVHDYCWEKATIHHFFGNQGPRFAIFCVEITLWNIHRIQANLAAALEIFLLI